MKSKVKREEEADKPEGGGWRAGEAEGKFYAVSCMKSHWARWGLPEALQNESRQGSCVLGKDRVLGKYLWFEA